MRRTSKTTGVRMWQNSSRRVRQRPSRRGVADGTAKRARNVEIFVVLGQRAQSPTLRVNS